MAEGGGDEDGDWDTEDEVPLALRAQAPAGSVAAVRQPRYVSSGA